MEVEIVNQSENRMVIKDNEGNIHECEKLFTFDSDETKLSYICYTDMVKDKDGNTLVYAGTYDPTGESNIIKQIETDKEWGIIQATLEQIIKATGDNNEE